MAKLGFAEIDKAFRESGLSNSEIDKASTKFLINPSYKDATKDDLEKYIADYKDELGLHDITKTTVEGAGTLPSNSLLASSIKSNSTFWAPLFWM